MGIGTFGTFTQARLGIYAATKGLTVTGNNISNINTTGYTRQSLDQVSLRNGGADRYQSKGDVRIGNGALVRSVSQLRDPYLDIRFRNETSIVGYTNTMTNSLISIADIIDEVGKGTGDHEDDGVIFAQFSDFLSALEDLNTDAAAESNDTLTRAAADILVSSFNKYANKLSDLENETADQLKQELAGMNQVITGIRDLNVAIRKSEIHGDPALEMRDERNNLIDKLSEYAKVEVTYSMEDVGAGQQVEKLTIRLGNSNPDPDVDTDSTILIDGIYSREVKMPDTLPKANPDYDSTYNPTGPGDTNPAQYKYLMPDGVTGTNTPGDAEQIPNSNYDMSLGKLLDANGRQWSKILSSSVTKMAANDPELDNAPQKAVYSYTLETKGKNDPTATPPVVGWEAGDTIEIAGKEYKVGENISINTVSNANRLAAFAATKLSESGDFSDYDITSVDDKIVFTAKTAGKIGSKGPAKEPDLKLTGDTSKLTLGNRTEENTGEDADPDWQSSSVVDGDDPNTKVITTYTMRGADWYKTTINSEYSQEVDLDDNDLYGAIQAFREVLTEAGEFSTTDSINNVDESASQKRGIPYYRQSLDLLARVFAEAFNEANNGYAVDQNGNYLTKSGKKLELAGEPVNKTNGLTAGQKDALIADGCVLDDGSPDLERWLKAKEEDPNDPIDKLGGNLFSNRGDLDDAEGITAANISVSHSWSTGQVHIVNTFTKLFGGEVTNTTQDNNIGHMISLMGKDLLYSPKDLNPAADSDHLFEGTFHEMLISMCSSLGNDQTEISSQLNTSYTYMIEMDTSRDSVSAVDLNDEAMNLMQYAKSLNAAYRLMTTLDEALDKLINNTGIVGR